MLFGRASDYLAAESSETCLAATSSHMPLAEYFGAEDVKKVLISKLSCHAYTSNMLRV